MDVITSDKFSELLEKMSNSPILNLECKNCDFYRKGGYYTNPYCTKHSNGGAFVDANMPNICFSYRPKFLH